METEKIILQLTNQAEVLKAHLNRIKKPGYKIHELDVDLLRKKTYEFYDLVSELADVVEPKNTLKYIPKEERIRKKEVEEISRKVEDIVPEKVNPVELPVQEEKNEEFSKQVVKKEPDVVQTVVEKEKKPEIEQNIKILNDNQQKIQAPVEEAKKTEMPKPVAQQTTYDLFAESGDNPVAEKLKPKEEVSIADKMQMSKITNIREAIGINDKFLFINGLFNGDLEKYNKTLDEFNDLITKQGVETYLREVKIQYRWDQESDAFVRFKEIVDRKFS